MASDPGAWVPMHVGAATAPQQAYGNYSQAPVVEQGVVVSPGYQFGPSGLGHFRICYAREETGWGQALDRMVPALTGVAEGRR